MGRRKKRRPKPQGPIPWTFDPDIPTDDFFAGGPLTDLGNLQEAVENFVYWMEDDRFLTWEAIVCEELGWALTAPQKKALSQLISFDEDPADDILYIDETPRPSEPWYVILNQIVPHLLIEPFRTFDVHEEVKCDGWQRLMEALREHGAGLSLPAGVASVMEVVPLELRHKLWLQDCLNMLGGLGQADDLNLKDQTWRVKDFIDRLRECKDTVAYLGLTLEGLLTRVTLPERDRPLFLQMMSDQLGLSSAQEPIADRL
jgi:hypothetical protein